MSPSALSPLISIKALAFDVFGTTVDWRTSVTDELELRVHRKLRTRDRGAPSAALRARLEHLGADHAPDGEPWTARFADAWRAAYWRFVRSQARAGVHDAAAAFPTTEAHLRASLERLLDEWQLAGLFADAERASLSMVWHRLAPWPDTVPGLERLAAPPLHLQTATLSNGSTGLVRDLNDFGELGFQHLFCAESLRAYKPAPETYLGAAAALGLQPREVAMVAAHMADLEAARDVGLRTVYVERRGEEQWDADKLAEARTWVDLWISGDEDGFVALAERLEELRA
ncbi:haloacid dehalogenase, type II [Cordyceps militaris CM01]|uniref:Haloacid dehalogenase, type II n=1 Tax=Cordyceps militaris (strain CM01) TaxID=983644 RepID=G3JBY3_CORMM|nr:haloacid dehalogenase, type II [Cordyceps militaris CM01]EGX93701.1 haloacid dehalogenase, type II [Cordyceps militaris CM01]